MPRPKKTTSQQQQQTHTSVADQAPSPTKTSPYPWFTPGVTEAIRRIRTLKKLADSAEKNDPEAMAAYVEHARKELHDLVMSDDQDYRNAAAMLWLGLDK